MELSVANQAVVFLLSVALGFVLGFIYDIFRILRIAVRTKGIGVFIEDMLFWIICAVAVLLFLFVFTSGEVRMYTFIGTALGAVIYFMSLSILIMSSAKIIIIQIKKIIKFLLHIVAMPIIIVSMATKPLMVRYKRKTVRRVYFITHPFHMFGRKPRVKKRRVKSRGGENET
ncbi:MAG: spore cortex biosynthesis protein YabQ [Bacillota bacterium]|nr:spore cortex biosynthesis protein YabQ [Bacillota bacterium]